MRFITALIVPLSFDRVPPRIVALPGLAVALSWGLMVDGELSRVDGGILIAAYAAAAGYLLHLNKRGVDIKAGGEVAESLEKVGERSRLRSLARMVLSLVAIVAGSEMLVKASGRCRAGRK